MENSMYQGELNDLRERVRRDHQPVGGHPATTPSYSDDASRHRSLAERIDGIPLLPPARIAPGDHGEATSREDPSLPPTVAVRPIDIHPRFLPLGTHFQEGGTGGPKFSRPQDWLGAIHENPSVRPRGIRRWGPQPVNMDDLYVYLLIGQIFYGGNRPPGRHDPVDPQRQWKAIEAAFFRGTVGIILEPGIFRATYNQLTDDQRAPYRQPFLATVEDPNQLVPRDIIEHLVRSGITESWFQRDTVTEYARSYLRDWARHQTRLTPTTNLGRLFFILYPDDISHPEDRHFIEDAMRGEEPWGGNDQPETPQDEPTETHHVDSVEIPMDEPVETPMDEAPMEEDEDEDEVPPLEAVTPSTSEGTRRTMTPEDEKLDWGEEELYRQPQM